MLLEPWIKLSGGTSLVGPVGKTSPSQTGTAGLTPDQGAGRNSKHKTEAILQKIQ